MDPSVIGEQDLNWLRPSVFMAITLTAYMLLIYSCPNLGDLVGLFIVLPISTFILFIFVVGANAKSRRFCIALLFLNLLIGWPALKHAVEIRCETRWLFASSSWKRDVLAQPVENLSGMKYLVWDGWGMFAQDTDVYLVFSPDDKLRYYSPSNLGGLPCPVWHVQRLEKNWYSVTFYTEEGWDNSGKCGG